MKVTGYGAAQFWVRFAAEAQTDDCLLWPFYRMRKGYGQLKYGGRIRLATHVVLELAGHPRPAPPGDHALHSCPTGDNPACCNPQHLRWGTNQENIADKVRAGSQWRPRGELARTAKVTEADVREIRRRREQGETHAAIARDYGLSSQNVGEICRRRLWSHVS